MRRLMTGIALLGLLAGLGLAAEPTAGWPAKAKLWSQALKEGKTWISLPLANEASPRDPQGRWKSDSLAALLTQDPAWQMHSLDQPPAGARLARRKEPRVLLIENSSSVSPWSKRLHEWGWNARIASFEALENEPRRYLDAESVDLIVFSSPGWWQDFANPPSGPSRMGDSVASVIQDYLLMGGVAVFVDIAQWDLEAIGMTGLRMGQLGPRELVDFNDPWGRTRRLGLAAFGAMAQRLPKNSAPLLWRDDYENMDGEKGRAYAAFVSVPPQGLGFALGLAFHPLEQDQEVAATAQALVMQIWLLSGAKSVYWNSQAPKLGPLPSSTASSVAIAASARLVPSATAMKEATVVPPSPTAWPSPSLTPTLQPIVTRPLPRPSSSPTPLRRVMPTVRATASVTPSPLPVLPGPGPSYEAAPVKAKLSCLQSSPEPFSEGGVYLFFCIDQPAQLRYRIYDLKGRELAVGDLNQYQAGRNQIFYSGLNSQGKYLPKGRYFYRLEAVYSGRVAEWRQAEFNFKPKVR